MLAALGSLCATLAFLRIWSPKADPAYAIHRPASGAASDAAVPPWQGWIPWAVVAVTVIGWTHLKIALLFQQIIHWPGLHNAVFITLYHKPYAANWLYDVFFKFF